VTVVKAKASEIGPVFEDNVTKTVKSRANVMII